MTTGEDSSDPWYLTVVRTHGVLFVRPEKSWRPVVSVTVVNPHQAHELTLGSDGQNPNIKKPFVLRNVGHRSQLDIKVWHKSHSKNRKKRHLVGSAYLSLGDLVRQQEHPGSDLDLNLSCPPPQKKSPTIGGKQQHHATLTVRLYAPSVASMSSSQTIVASAPMSEGEDMDDRLSSSSKAPSETLVTPTVDGSWQEESLKDVLATAGDNQLRRRRKPRVRGYTIDSDGEGGSPLSSKYPSPLASPRDEYFPPFPVRSRSPSPSRSHKVVIGDQSPTVWPLNIPPMLPMHLEERSADTSLSVFEAIVDSIAPYRALQCARCDEDYEKVLGRLLTEWYVVGASLLALAGIYAALIGLNPGTMFPIDGPAQDTIALGAVASGVGVGLVSWQLLLYGGTDAARFQRRARDVYGSYLFFSLTCRLPTACMVVSAGCLMVFLIIVVWAPWQGTVLLMPLIVGVLFTLQYLVYGCHRVFEGCVWCVKRVRMAWRGTVRVDVGERAGEIEGRPRDEVVVERRVERETWDGVVQERVVEAMSVSLPVRISMPEPEPYILEEEPGKAHFAA